jgi:predicted enzyme related to lactoylglutathione lyase
MVNPFVQVELVTQDLQKSRDFYSQLFDWKLEHVSMGAESYTLRSASAKIPAASAAS